MGKIFGHNRWADLNKERHGELLIFGEVALWSLFPIITILASSKLSPLMALSGSSFFSALFFAIIISIKKEWKSIANKGALGDIMITTFLLAIVYYLFFFFGLKHTSAGNASIIALTEVLFAFLFFHVWRKEHISPQYTVGIVMMILGATIVLYPNLTKFNIGDMMILAASAIAPFGNFFQRRARQKIGSVAILFIRSSIASVFVFGLALFLDPVIPTVNDVRGSIAFLAINGALILGLSKILWIEGIHRISVAKANAFNALGPVSTLFFAWLILGNSVTVWQIWSFVLVFPGIWLLTRNGESKVS